MKESITTCLNNLEMGEMQVHENLVLIPLRNEKNTASLFYITMTQALEEGVLKITEINEGGSIPSLKAVNKGQKGVVILDGEEVTGAKQNRILNITVFIPPQSDVILPVSCTEQGRWSYISEKFQDSEIIMSPDLRRKKMDSVRQTLLDNESYAGNQRKIWEEIRHMSEKTGVESNTDAMKDIYTSRRENLEKYCHSFSPLPGQKGILILINGRVAGLDYLSRAEALEKVFKKLINSYAMEALLQKDRKKEETKREQVEEFLKKARKTEEKTSQPPGQGDYHVFQGPDITGSALVVEDEVIHISFFESKDKNNQQ